MGGPSGVVEFGGWKDGEVIDVDPFTMTRRVYRDIDDKHGAIVTEYYGKDQLLGVNADERSLTAGTRWGEGATVGRVPFHLLTDPNLGLLDAVKAHDDAFIRRFLNENPSLKTRDAI